MTILRSIIRLLVSCAIFASSGVAFASDSPGGLRPVQEVGIFPIFTTKTVAESAFVLEPGIELVREPDIERISLRAAYGISRSTDASFSASARRSPAGDGAEDVGIGIRHRFSEEGKFGPSAAFLIAASLPAGKESRGTGSGSVETEAILITSKRVGPFTGHLNLGYNVILSGKSNNELIYGGALDFSAAKRIVLLAEIHGRSVQGDDILEASLGYKNYLSDSISNTIGIGWGLGNREPEYRITVLFTLGPAKEPSQLIHVKDDGL